MSATTTRIPFSTIASSDVAAVHTRPAYTKKQRLSGLLVLSLLAASACYSDGPDAGEAEAVGSVSQTIAGSSLCDDPSTATIVGTAGDDYILGTPGDDVIFGLGGADFIDGKGGNDILCGGAGKDSLKGGDGNDVLHGGDGYNSLHGNDGDDIIFGGDDGNELQGGLGQDTLVGGAGNDWMLGGDDNDILLGGGGDDDMDGGAGDDSMSGEGGKDWMMGGYGNDCMDGGPGDDRLHGQDGDDGLMGGDGIDKVACGEGSDTHDGGEWDYSGCESAGMCTLTTQQGGGLGNDASSSSGGGALGNDMPAMPAVTCFEADCSQYPGDAACCDEDTSLCNANGVCEQVPGDIEGVIWIDFNGDGVMDASDVTGAGATVDLFEDMSPADGMPDGPPVATAVSGADGSYGFDGVLGGHLVRVNVTMLPPGFCQSYGQHSVINPLTGYSDAVIVLGANPKNVVSGIDIGVKFSGCQ